MWKRSYRSDEASENCLSAGGRIQMENYCRRPPVVNNLSENKKLPRTHQKMTEKVTVSRLLCEALAASGWTFCCRYLSGCWTAIIIKGRSELNKHTGTCRRSFTVIVGDSGVIATTCWMICSTFHSFWTRFDSFSFDVWFVTLFLAWVTFWQNTHL